MRLRLAPLLTLAWLTCGCGTVPSARPDSPATPDLAGPVALELPRLGGGFVSLEQLRGQPVVVTLFATWSLRSQAEAPLFVQLHERYGQVGLQLVGVALDTEGRALVKTYADFVGFTFDIAVVPVDDPRLVAALGKTRRVPRTLLLDRAGRIIQDHDQGQTDMERLLDGVQELLKK